MMYIDYRKREAVNTRKKDNLDRKASSSDMVTKYLT